MTNTTQAPLSDRERVNAHIEACGTGIRAGHTPVTIEHVEEMRDALPPEFMGKRDCFHYVQVGEAYTHAIDRRRNSPTHGQYVEYYETYTMVTDKDANALTTAYTPNQWYFIGLKPSLNE